MPTVGDIRTDLEKIKIRLWRRREASPGYYRVNLKTYGILAEMTATTHAGMSQYTFPERKGSANILNDVSHRLTTDPVTMKSPIFESHVKIVSATEVEGSTQSGDFCSVYAGNKQTVYFVVRFSKPAVRTGTWKGPVLKDEKEQLGQYGIEDIGAFFRFPPPRTNPLWSRLAFPLSALRTPRLNLEAEMTGWDFELVKAATQYLG